jgi:OmpA-OmpF porin, OOP family
MPLAVKGYVERVADLSRRAVRALIPITWRFAMKLKTTLAAVAVAAALPMLAQAQSRSPMTSSTAESYSLLPGTTRGYVAGSLGRAEFDAFCAFNCDDPDISGKVVTGGSWSNMVGFEVGYIYFGSANRNGGDSDAQGVNLSLVGNLPIGDVFNVFAKIGTTYGWTDVSVAPGFGFASGTDNGFGLSYGLGVGYDLNRNWTVIGEWEEHRLKFVGSRDDVSLLSVGVKYRF